MSAYTQAQSRHGGRKSHQILDWADAQPDNPWKGYWVKTRRNGWHLATDREREILGLPPRLPKIRNAGS